MKLLGRKKKVVDKDKNGGNVPKLEIVEVVLVHCNLFTFVPNKKCGQLINISPHAFAMMNTVNTEFSYVEVWFTWDWR